MALDHLSSTESCQMIHVCLLLHSIDCTLHFFCLATCVCLYYDHIIVVFVDAISAGFISSREQTTDELAPSLSYQTSKSRYVSAFLLFCGNYVFSFIRIGCLLPPGQSVMNLGCLLV